MKKIFLLFLLLAGVVFASPARQALHLKGTDRAKLQPIAEEDWAYGLYGDVFTTDGTSTFVEMTPDPKNPGAMMFQGEMNAGSFYYVIYDKQTKEIFYSYGADPSYNLKIGDLSVYAYEGDAFVVPKGKYEVRLGPPYILILNQEATNMPYYDAIIMYRWADAYEADAYIMNISLGDITNPVAYLKIDDEKDFTKYPLNPSGSYVYYTNLFYVAPETEVAYTCYPTFEADGVTYTGRTYSGNFTTSPVGFSYTFNVIEAGEDYAIVEFSFYYNFTAEKEYVLNYTVWEEKNENKRISGTYNSNNSSGTFTVNGLKPGTDYLIEIIGEINSKYGTLSPDYTTPGWFATIGDSGVAGIGADSDAAVKYFTIDGREVSNPQKGLYIKVEGKKASKVVL